MSANVGISASDIDTNYIASPRTLTTTKIIGLILGVLTPLSCLVATVPLGLAFGGNSMPLAFLLIAVMLGIFCIGYVELVRRITRPGAAYSYIARGLGRRVGAGAAFVCLTSCLLTCLGAFAIVAPVLSTLFTTFGVYLGWQWMFAFEVIISGVLLWYNVDFSARVLRFVVMLELALFVALGAAIAFRHGANAFPLELISPTTLATGHWTVTFIFAIMCFQGFESGAVYSPEAINPEKTVPRALIAVISILAVAFLFITWELAAVAGSSEVLGNALMQDPSSFVFVVVGEYLGSFGAVCFSIMAIAGAFAACIAVANFSTRYLSGVALDSLLPAFLVHENRHGSPIGSATLTLSLVVITGLVSVAFALDPYAQVGAILFGWSTVAITAIQLVASLAVIGFFIRFPDGTNRWRTFAAPLLAAALLGGAVVVEMGSLEWLTGSTAPWVLRMTAVFPGIFVLGYLFSLWLRKNRPATYAGLAAGDTMEEVVALRQERVRSAQLVMQNA